MRVLLVALNAKYIHSNLAVYSLMAYANKYKKHMSLLELTINHNEEDILKEIYKKKADVVAFSCYIWNISIIRRISYELKKVQPKVQIWFGGPEVSYDMEKTLTENTALDGIMYGEGEQTFLEWMEYCSEGNLKLEDIQGLAFRNKSGIIITKHRQPTLLDSVPFPYEDMEIFKNKIIYYESSRGCPYSCSYCLSSIDKKVRFRGIEIVKKELKIFLDYQVPQVKFVDRTFNCNKQHAMDIWKFIKENDNGITNFHFEISADLLEDEEISFLASLRPGQIQFEIGVQSTNPETVKAIHRKMDFRKLSYNVGRIKEGKNIHQHLDLIAGLPLEGYDCFEKSFQDVYELKPDQLQMGFLKILKGSPMEEESKSYGITYHKNPPYEVLFTEHLTYDEVLKMKGVCDMVEVYYNSGQFTYTFQFLDHFFDSPMRLYQAISDFYEYLGISLMSHSRIKRYEILLDFFDQMMLKSVTDEEKEIMVALFKEILLLDIFLREDLKSRPGFAKSVSTQSNLRELYEKNQGKQKKIHIEQFRFDVLKSAISGQAIKKDVTVLFDYNEKDPLNKSAKITLI